MSEESEEISVRKRWTPGMPKIPGAAHTRVRRIGDTEVVLERGDYALTVDADGGLRMSVNSERIVEDHLLHLPDLTGDLQGFFEHVTHDDPSLSFAERIEEWVEKRGGKVEGGDNTYNWEGMGDWIGSVFEYIRFRLPKNKRELTAIMWHHGGDSRVGYDYPRVYAGDFDEFRSVQERDEPRHAADLLDLDQGWEHGVLFAYCLMGFFSDPEGDGLPLIAEQAIALMKPKELLAFYRFLSSSKCPVDPGLVPGLVPLLRREWEREGGQRALWPWVWED